MNPSDVREGMERRQAADGRQYTMQEFQDHYGSTWEWHWERSHRASAHPRALPLSSPPSWTHFRDAERISVRIRDAETLLAGPQASGVGSSRAAGSRDDDRPAMLAPQGDVGTAPIQASPTGGATGAEMPG